MKSVLCLFASFFFFSALCTSEFYPAEWVRQDLRLAEFLVDYGKIEEKMRTLQEILDLGCATGNQKLFHWVIEKQTKTGLCLSFTTIANALEKIVHSGFDHLIAYFPHLLDVSVLSEGQKEGSSRLRNGRWFFFNRIRASKDRMLPLPTEQQQRLAQLEAYFKRGAACCGTCRN